VETKVEKNIKKVETVPT